MYNQISNSNVQYMASGGALATLAGSTEKYLAKYLTDSKKLKSLEMLGKSLAKKNTALSQKIKLFTQGNLDVEGVREMQRLAQEHYHKSGSYLARKAKIELAQRYRKQAIELLDKVAKGKAAQTEQVVQAANPIEQVVQAANPIPGNTLSGWWRKSKKWVNEHPKTTFGIPLIAASGIGRDALSGVAALYTARPFTSDTSGESGNTKYLEVNGTKIPITMLGNGNFTLSPNQDENQTVTSVGDDIDALIAGASTPVNSSTVSQISSDTSQPDYNSINDLFEDYQ